MVVGGSDDVIELPGTVAEVHHAGQSEQQAKGFKLSSEMSETLEKTVTPKTLRYGGTRDAGQGGHGHHEKPMSLASAVASGLINYLLMFGLCCAYGMIMFDENHVEHRALGVKMNMGTAMLAGYVLSWKCGVNVAIGGPDLNPVVFLGGFIATLSQDIADQLGLEFPDSARRLADEGGLWRRLGGATTSEATFCVGTHLQDHMVECTEYHEQLRATTIFAVAVSSAALGLTFFLSGRFHLTRYAGYVPTCVMEAFMACVGYKVFKYALLFCHYEPQQFVPAAAVGVPLYFVKAYHIGNPAMVIPAMLLIPLAFFYVILYGSGRDLNHADEWMFPALDNFEFYKIWMDSIGKPSKVNFKAWTKTLTELMIMILVCFMDCLLKLLGTEGKLPVKVDKDKEMQLFGVVNAVTTCMGGTVGYMQLKFNVINFGILGNKEDRRGGFVYATLCAVTYFWTIEHFNYLPRFFLGILLFFAGAGFVAENLWGSRKYLSFSEWMQILIILTVFILMGDLLYAVIVGVLLTCIDFILTYAKVPCFVKKPRRGSERSCVRRQPLVTSSVKHLLNTWLLVVRLKGFIFFAAAQSLIAEIRKMIEDEEDEGVPRHRRLHFVIFDCKLMDGMDASTAKVLRKLTKDAEKLKVMILYSNASATLEERLRKQELVVRDEQSFREFDDAMIAIEDYALEYRNEIQSKWMRLHPNFAQQQKSEISRAQFEPFKDVFLFESARHGCPWKFCRGVALKRFSTMLWKPGQTDIGLFLVHSGSVALFRELPAEDQGFQESESWPAPVAVYKHGWFLNRECLINMPTRYYAVALEDGEVVSWSRAQWARMDRMRPRMACEIQRAVMKQQALDSDHDEPEQVSKAIRDAYLPEEITSRLSALRTARAMGSMGLYDPPASGETLFLPDLPDTIKTDLRTAFSTFCVRGNESAADQSSNRAKRMSIVGLSMDSTGPKAPENGQMPWDRIQEAFMFAGLFDSSSLLESQRESLNMQEFQALGHKAAMAALSPRQVARLEKIFRDSDEDRTEALSPEELGRVLQDVFETTISQEEVVYFLDGWAPDCEHVDKELFLAVASRLLRIHEQDWQLYIGLKDVLGAENVEAADGFESQLTVERVRLQADLGEEEAAELLWTGDWRRAGRGEGKVLDFCDVLAAVLLPAWRSQGSLPSTVKAKETSRISFRAGASRICLDDLPGVDAVVPAEPTAWVEEPVKLKDEGPLTCRQKLYYLLEEPTSSRPAQILWVVMATLILCSVLTMILQPLVSKAEKRTKAEKQVWFAIELFFTLVFTAEYLLRLAVCNAIAPGAQAVKQFVVQPSNLCDLVAIMPFYVEVIVFPGLEDSGGYRLLRIIRLLRLTRITRIARLAKRNPLFGPVCMVLLVIWFIYLKTSK